MARPRREVMGVRLRETCGSDRAAVARALYSWAAMLADEATAATLKQEPTASQNKLPPTSP